MKITVDHFGAICFFPLTEPVASPGVAIHELSSADEALLAGLKGKPVWVPETPGDLEGPGHLEEQPAKPAAPRSVTFGQAHAAMRLTPLGEGTVLDAVEAMIAAARQSTEVNHVVLTSFWDAKSNLLRTSPSVVALGAQLGFTDEQIDAIFILAASFNA